MNEASITQYITESFDGVHAADAWGYTFFYYNPGSKLPDEIYFASLMNKDDDYDNFSNLNRPSTFRLNIGLSKATYRSLFGAPPSRLSKEVSQEREVERSYDFTALDQVLPHPIYGRQYWVCVINPSDETFQRVIQPLLAEAYEVAVGKFEKQNGPRTGKRNDKRTAKHIVRGQATQ
jgi:hypothetical protein